MMNFPDAMRMLRRQLLLVIAATVIGLSVGALTAMLTPARYEASTDVFLSVEVAPDATTTERAAAAGYVTQVIDSYRSVINSSLVLRPVIDALGLDVSVAQLSDSVQTAATLRSAVVTITVSNANPGQAARIANGIADSFGDAVADKLENRTADSPYGLRVVQVQRAQVPVSPVAPNFGLSLAVGSIIGLGAGIGLALLRATLDTRIRTVDDLERAVDKPVLGRFALAQDAGERPLVVAADPTDPRAEAFRALRTNMQFLFPEGTTGTFVITSAGPGEGKSTVAANLAISFAENGRRVVLIDADLRLPRVAETFGIDGAVGLSDALVGRLRLSDALQRWGSGALFVLPAGTLPPNPAELLGSEAMHTLLTDLSTAFDVIILDTPPVLPVTDAAVVSRFATGVVVVAASGSTQRPRLGDAVSAIEATGTRVLGTVITMLPPSRADRAGYGTPQYTAWATVTGRR